MKVITLKGAHNTGKTETMTELYELLKADSDNYTMVEDKYSIFGKNIQSPPRGRDFFAILENKSDCKIGISSYGDNYDIIIKSLEEFSKKGCNIVLIACLTSGNTHSAIKEYDHNPVFINKTKIEHQDRKKTNLEDAKKIKKTLDSI